MDLHGNFIYFQLYIIDCQMLELEESLFNFILTGRIGVGLDDLLEQIFCSCPKN